MLATLKNTAKSLLRVHWPSKEPNVFIFSVPRSGSTWLTELVWTQPGFQAVGEPLNLRNPLVRRHLGIDDWFTLYRSDSEDKLRRYFASLCGGGFRFLTYTFHNYRWLTRRLVFKVLHGAEDHSRWLGECCNGRVVLLIRHPIPVTLSRQVLPRLHAFIDSDYRRHFSHEQCVLAEKISDHGSNMERGTLSWCLQNAVLLRELDNNKNLIAVTYEQLVLEPMPVIRFLSAELQLPKPDRIVTRLSTPSSVVHKSDPYTQALLQQGLTDARMELVTKWRRHVSLDEERRVIDILRVFGIDVYQFGQSEPKDSFWISSHAS